MTLITFVIILFTLFLSIIGMFVTYLSISDTKEQLRRKSDIEKRKQVLRVKGIDI